MGHNVITKTYIRGIFLILLIFLLQGVIVLNDGDGSYTYNDSLLWFNASDLEGRIINIENWDISNGSLWLNISNIEGRVIVLEGLNGSGTLYNDSLLWSNNSNLEGRIIGIEGWDISNTTIWSNLSNIEGRLTVNYPVVYPWLLNDSSQYAFNETKLNSTVGEWLAQIVYNATTANITVGTLQGGNHEGIWEDQDGKYYNITEASGGIDVTVNFTGVTGIEWLDIYENYKGGSGHIVNVQIYDFGASDWENYGSFADQTGYFSFSYGIPDPAAHISGGLVSVRFYHSSPGSIQHLLSLDMVRLRKGGGGSSADLTPSSIAWAVPYSNGTKNLDLTPGKNVSAANFIGSVIGAASLNVLKTGDTISDVTIDKLNGNSTVNVNLYRCNLRNSANNDGYCLQSNNTQSQTLFYLNKVGEDGFIQLLNSVNSVGFNIFSSDGQQAQFLKRNKTVNNGAYSFVQTDSIVDWSINGSNKGAMVPTQGKEDDIGSASQSWDNAYFDDYITTPPGLITLSKYQKGDYSRITRFNDTAIRTDVPAAAKINKAMEKPYNSYLDILRDIPISEETGETGFYTIPIPLRDKYQNIDTLSLYAYSNALRGALIEKDGEIKAMSDRIKMIEEKIK